MNEVGKTLVEMVDVCKEYRMGKVNVPALQKLNLCIEQGEYLAIVGPSGSGKSTLLNLLGCLDLPTEGTYRLRGKDVRSLGDAQLSRLRGMGIGFVFQDYSLLKRFSALRNVELPHYYMAGRGNHKRAAQLLESVGLGGRLAHRPTELSGGEQQRVAVARALINDPFMLLADEPTGNLDSKSGQELMAILERLNSEQGLTLIVVTHDPSVSSRARRLIRLRDGMLVSDEVQSNSPAVGEVG